VFSAEDPNLDNPNKEYKNYGQLYEYLRDTFKLIPMCIITRADKIKDIKDVVTPKVAEILSCPLEVCHPLANYEFTLDSITHDIEKDINVLKILRTALFCAEKHIRLALRAEKLNSGNNNN